MADLNNFNANDYEPASFDVIPAGEYTAIIVSSDMKNTLSGGEMLVLELVIIEGPYRNRKIWDRLNIVNNSEKAMEIAKGTLSAICRAVDVMTPRDSAELHNKPMIVKVGIRPARDGYDESNEIKAYRPRPVGVVAQEMSQAAATQPVAETPASDDIPF